MMNPSNLSITERPVAGLLIADLPIADRIWLVEDLWDSIAAEPASLPMTDAQKAELNRRLEAYASDGVKGDLADEAIKDIRSRLCR